MGVMMVKKKAAVSDAISSEIYKGSHMNSAALKKKK